MYAAAAALVAMPLVGRALAAVGGVACLSAGGCAKTVAVVAIIAKLAMDRSGRTAVTRAPLQGLERT